MAEIESGRETPAAGDTTSPSLLARARANDAEAWARLVRLYHPLVAAWCARGGVPAADVDDVAQEVFAATAAGLVGFRRDRPGDTFRGWLRVVTRHQVALYFRRARRQPRAEGGSDALTALQAVPEPPVPSPEEDAVEVRDLYRRALEQVRGGFEEGTWRAFWMTVVEGRATAAVADDLGVTPAAVRQSRSRVLRRLKEEVGEVLD
jgi:RNA polymerase sigma-70 factor (ECF subfamily)